MLRVRPGYPARWFRTLNNKGEVSSGTLSRVHEVIERLDYRLSSVVLVDRSLPGRSMVCVDDDCGRRGLGALSP